MADKKISELQSASAVGTSVVPASNAAGTVTNKVTLQAIANLAQPAEIGAVASSITGITGATAVTNVVKISQANYDAIVTPDPTTLYIIVG